MRSFDPRYLAYSRFCGRTPEEQDAHDTRTNPRMRLAGFLRWMEESWSRFSAETGTMRSPAAGAAFDAWLDQTYPKVDGAAA